MNIINKIKFNIYYSKFKDLDISDAVLKKMISDKAFLKTYRNNSSVINGFIDALKNYEYMDYFSKDEASRNIKHKLDSETITSHIEAVMELSKTGNQNKYVSYTMNNFYYRDRIKNYNVFNYNEFDQLYNIIGHSVFNDNIAQIINNKHGDRLLFFLQKYPNKIAFNDLNDIIFNDEAWSLVQTNDKLGNTTLVDLMSVSKFYAKKIAEIIKDGNYGGFKYTFESIPESQNFIHNYMTDNFVNSDIFSQNFINSLGVDTLTKLYQNKKFYNQSERERIVELVKANNPELVRDGINFTRDFSFAGLNKEEINKDILEIHNCPKKDVFLNKYFGIQYGEIRYIILFLESIKKVPLTDNFNSKYGEIYGMLEKVVYEYNDSQLINASKQFDVSKKDYYNQLIKALEEDGNKLIKNEFASQLRDRNMDIQNNIPHEVKEFADSKGGVATIDVYEFSGQPFTMMVHSVTDNVMSSNNRHVKEIVENPENWETISNANNFISTSLISDKYMVTYGTPNKNNTVMYGFSDIDSETLRYTQDEDVGINREASAGADINMRNMLNAFPHTNTVTTVDILMQKTIDLNSRKQPASRMWNEIGLLRENPEKGYKIKPNYIVCMDNICQSSIDAAKYFNLPIYLIHTKAYSQLPYIPTDDKSNLGDDDFSELPISKSK